MDLNLENISRLDSNSSYYLSDNGEIKKSGLLHKFKCFFNFGHSRQRVANLINAIRNTIAEASGGAANFRLDEQFQTINQKSAVKGSVIKEFAETFRTANQASIAHALAKREAVRIIDSTILDLEAKGNSKIKNSPKLQELLYKALEIDIDEPPVVNKDGRNVLDLEHFKRTVSQKLNAISSCLIDIVNDERLGKPQLSNDYVDYLKGLLISEDGDITRPDPAALKKPDEAFAQLAAEDILKPDSTEGEIKLFNEGVQQILSECKDDPDLRDLLTLNYKTILTKGDDVIRSKDEVQKKINAIKSNLQELRQLSAGNPQVFNYGKQILSGESGKTFVPGSMTKMFNYVNSADIKDLLTISDRSSAFEMQKAVNKLVSILVDGAGSSGAELNDIIEASLARSFIAGMLTLRLSPAERQTLVKVFESMEFSRLDAAYVKAQENFSSARELPGQIRYLYSSSTLSIRKTIDSFYTALCTITGKEEKQYQYIGNVDDKLISQVSTDIKAQADPLAERTMSEFFARHFKGDSLGFIRDHLRNTMLTGQLKLQGRFSPSQLFNYMVQNQVNSHINSSFIEQMKQLTGTNPQEAAFFRDLGRMNVKLPDGRMLSKDPATAADEIAAFVTGRAEAKFDALTDAEKAKVRVVMSLLTTNTAKAVTEAVPAELDKNKSLTLNEAQDKGRFTISLDNSKFGSINISCQYENEITSFVHNRQQTVLNPGSTVKGEVVYSISLKEIERLSKLDFRSIDNQQAVIPNDFRIAGDSVSMLTMEVKQ